MSVLAQTSVAHLIWCVRHTLFFTVQSLSEINLDGYTVMDCEPLHDLKGHLINLLPEIPHVLAGENKRIVTELLQTLLLANKQNGYSGSDLRICLIELDCLVQC